MSTMKRPTLVGWMGAMALAAVVGAPGTAKAATLTYVPNNTDLQDLDHHNIYTWVISGVNTQIPSGQTVTGAYLFFDNIRNWDSSANRLFMHLLDTALTNNTYALPTSASHPAGAIWTSSKSFTTTDDTSTTPTGLVDNFAVAAGNQYTAPTRSVPAASAGLSRFDASIAPPEVAPAPITVWISSMNRIAFLWFSISLTTCFKRSSKSPR